MTTTIQHNKADGGTVSLPPLLLKRSHCSSSCLLQQGPAFLLLLLLLLVLLFLLLCPLLIFLVIVFDFSDSSCSSCPLPLTQKQTRQSLEQEGMHTSLRPTQEHKDFSFSTITRIETVGFMKNRTVC